MNRLLRLLLGVAFAASLVSHPIAARAACGALPYVFQDTTGTNSLVEASTTNANNSFLLSCALNVDYTQIGAYGIFASQIIPQTPGQAIFGGSQGYQMPAGLTTNGSNPLCLSCSTGFSSTIPFIGNSGESGLNFSFGSASTLGARFFKATAGTPSLVFSIDPSGNVTNAGNSNVGGNVVATGSISSGGTLNVSGIYNSIGTSANNGVLQVPGTGQLFLNLASGGNVAIGNGAGGLSGITFGTNGTIVSANETTGVETATQVSHTGGGSFPFAAGENSANEQLKHGSVAATSGGTAVTGLTFTNSTSYDCTFGPQHSPISIAYDRNSGSQMTVYGGGTVSWICLGY